MMRPILVIVAACVVGAMVPVAAQTTIGPTCPPYYNPFCCQGQFVNGQCECWSDQTFGPNCNYNCRIDLCDNHGTCDSNSNPVVDLQTGDIISGTCVCDPSGEWWGPQCTANVYNPTCSDKVKNGQETDVDCGGPTCNKCSGGHDCNSDTDCLSAKCDNGKCTDESCSDGTKNGYETDVDCGGGTCPKCINGKTCSVNNDCISGLCTGGVCMADNQPPVWVSPTPKTTASDKTINVHLRINEPGVAYLVLVANGASAPTVSNLVAGKGHGGSTPIYGSGAIQLPNPNANLVFQIPKTLASNTEYDVYVVASDDRQPPNFQINPVKLDETTKPSDVDPPEFWILYPRVKTTSDTSVTFETALNEVGTVYFVVSEPSTATPTASAVKSGSVAKVASGSISVGAAWTIFEKLVGSLQKNHEYKAFFAAEDSGGRLLTTVITLNFTTTNDKTPPNFVDSTPIISQETTQGFTVTVKIDEPGWFYVVVLPQGAAAPTSLQVVQGVGGDGNAALAHASTQVNSANSPVMVQIKNLEDDTMYDVWIVAADNLINVQPAPVKRIGTTLKDTTAPVMANGYPTITAVTSHSATVTVQIDEPGTCYALAMTRALPAPSNTQVRDGIVSADSHTTIPVSKGDQPFFNLFAGLSHSTNYTAYIVCADDSSPANLMSTVTAIDFRTPADVYAPAFVPPSPTVSDETHNSAKLNVVLDDPGTVFYVVLEPNAATPSQADIVAGTGAGGASAVTQGNFAVSTVLQAQSTTMTGLTKLTNYIVYMVTRDASNNVGVPRNVSFVTKDRQDVDAPGYRPTYPKLHTITTTSATLAVRLTEPGQTFYIVTLYNASQTPPTQAQILGSRDAYGNVPATSGSMVVTAADVTFSSVMASLTPDTEYTVFLFSRDNEPNIGEVVPIDFRTLPDGSCFDGSKNQQESDVDCGGPACPKCTNGKTCLTNTDCASNTCAGGVCVAGPCEDGSKNGGETDVDCGGPTCTARCANGKTCSLDSDCSSGNCDSGICQPGSCTGCAATEITVSPCSGAVNAVCKVKTPTITENLHTASKTVVTLAPTTTGSYIVATRDCAVPSCSVAAGLPTNFDDDGFVKTIQTVAGTSATFNLFESSLVRAVSCKAGVQDSDVVSQVVRVSTKDVKVFASTTLYIRALADFHNDRRDNFRLSVATVSSLHADDVDIVSAVPNAASPSDTTDVVYSVVIASNNTAEAISSCNTITTVLNNVEGNGNLRAELLKNDVIEEESNGGGGGGNQGGNTGTNETPGLFDFTGGVAWLWWLIPLILLLLLCCCLFLCCMRKREREKYHRQDSSFRGDIVPRANQVSPAPSVGSGEPMLEDPTLAGAGGAPAVRHTGRSRHLDDDDMLQGGADDGYGADGGGDDEPMMDLTQVVDQGEMITETIEVKGDTVFAYTGTGAPPAVVMPGMSSNANSVVSAGSRPPSAYGDGAAPVGLEDLNALNIRALSFTRNTPGASSYRSLSRHNTSTSSNGSVSSGLRVWAGGN